MIGDVIDALTSAAATLELAAKRADELTKAGEESVKTTQEWCDDTAVEIRTEAERVRRLFGTNYPM